jgi:Sulfotransferase family
MHLHSLKGQIYRSLPYRLQVINLIRHHSDLWKRTGVVFIHIPKAAGTSLNLALYGKFMGHFTASDVRRWASADVNALPSFAVTRNPWDRLVSAYRFLKRGKGVGGGHQVVVRRAQRYQLPAFETFERFVREWLIYKDVAKSDLALQPQSLFVCDSKGKILVDHLGRVEDMKPTIDFLREKLGYAPEISRSNRSGDPVDYRDFYTSQLADLVGTIYARDVEAFGYEF